MVTLDDAKAVATKVAQAIDPVCIVAFGSVAKRGWGQDLDVLIVTEDQGEEAPVLFRRVHQHLEAFYKQFAIDPFVMPRSVVKEYFRKGSPFLRLVQRQGRCLYMKEATRQWVKQATEDLAMANYLLQGEYYRGACYHGQQTVEKVLKAALLQKGWELEKVHSIERLKALGEQYGVEPEVSEEEAVLIDSVYRGRYPAEEGLLPTGEPTQEDARCIVSTAARVLERVFPI